MSRRHELQQLAQVLELLEQRSVPETLVLRSLHDAEQALAALVDAHVIEARAQGLAWSAIGASLKISAQGAQARHARLDAAGKVPHATPIDDVSAPVSVPTP
jgi:hypothetical protein